MILGFITLGFMAMTIILKWFSVGSLQAKRSRLAATSEEYEQARFRLKVAVGEATNASREIEKLKRKLKRVWLLLFDVYLRGLTGTYG